MNSRRSFLETLRMDMHAMQISHTSILSMIVCFFKRTDFPAVFLYRAASALHKKGMLGKAVATAFWRLNVLFNACDIDSHAVIGEGFSLPHPVGVVIGRVIVGRNVEVYQNVTMGLRRRGSPYSGPNSTPQIGDNVNIYAGAVIAGGVKIGSGARVAANTLVTSDVPADCTIIGVPGKILTYEDQIQLKRAG